MPPFLISAALSPSRPLKSPLRSCRCSVLGSGLCFCFVQITQGLEAANIPAANQAIRELGMSVSATQKMTVRRHELLTDLADRTMAILEHYGLDSNRAQDAADAIVDDLADNWGGQYITVPKDMKYRHAKRRQAIADAFDGTNHSELATQFGLSVNAIYKVLKRAQAK